MTIRIREDVIVPREYQSKIASSALKSNTLVVLPTGLGKTVVALLVSEARLRSGDFAKVLFLAPTKPLADQHFNTFRSMLALEEGGEDPDRFFSLLTGDISPERRQNVWSNSRLIFATPETVLNDLNSGRASLRDFALLVFDEAHRCVKDYAYTEIARQYVKQAENQLILGLTASPGGSEERIEDVMRNLFIDRVEARTESDRDVMPYVEETRVETIRVTLPPAYVQVTDRLNQLYTEKLAKLRRFGFLRFKAITKKTLLQSRVEIVQRMKGSRRKAYLFGALFVQSQAVMILHATELIQTQGAFTLLEYLTKLREDPEQGRAGKALLKDERWMEVEAMARDLGAVEHPKMEKLRSLVKEQVSKKAGSRIIVFTQYRDTMEPIMSAMADLGVVKAERFVGQATRSSRDRGLKQKEQAQVLDRFRDGAFNVLVSSSIGEEGLHVPDVDLVVFYEAVPSEIRSIQRRGRTGRTMPGRVVILLAEGTIDEAYFLTTANKERRMKRLVKGEREKKEATAEEEGLPVAAKTSGGGHEEEERSPLDYRPYYLKNNPFPQNVTVVDVSSNDPRVNGDIFFDEVFTKELVALSQMIESRTNLIYVDGLQLDRGIGKSAILSHMWREITTKKDRPGDNIIFTAFVRCTESAPVNQPAGICAAVIQRLHEQGFIWRAFWTLMRRYSEERNSLLFTVSSIETLCNAFPRPVDSLPLRLYTQVSDPARLAKDVAKWLEESFKCSENLSNALAYAYLTKPNSFPTRLTTAGSRSKERAADDDDAVGTYGDILSLLRNGGFDFGYIFLDQFEDSLTSTPAEKMGEFALGLRRMLEASSGKASLVLTLDHDSEERMSSDPALREVRRLAPVDVERRVSLNALEPASALAVPLVEKYMKRYREGTTAPDEMFPLDPKVVRYVCFLKRGVIGHILRQLHECIDYGAAHGYKKLDMDLVLKEHSSTMGVEFRKGKYEEFRRLIINEEGQSRLTSPFQSLN